MLSVLLISGLAMGGEWIEVFDDPDYPDSTYMDGVDGWSSGYEGQGWQQQYGGWFCGWRKENASHCSW